MTMKSKQILQSFANTTTMHGVPKVILARSTLSRIFWSVICMTAGLIFCGQMSEVLRRFFSYPKKVTVEVVSTPVPFPSVSLCNMRNLDFHILNTLNRKFLEDHQPLSHINASENAFIREYMKIVAKYGPLWYKYQDMHPVIFQEVFSRTTLSANIPEPIISMAAVQLEEFIVTCYFGGHACNRTSDFWTFFDPYYFNCFTYNAPHSSTHSGDTLLSLSEGIENGWSAIVLTGSGMLDKNPEIRVLPGLHESRSPVAASEGVRVVIHPPNTQPFPFAEGHDVPPGYSASFGIRPRKNIRIGPPHGDCMHTNPFAPHADEEDEIKNLRYRGISCQKMCIQSHVIARCGCFDASLPKLKISNKPCRRNDEFPESCMFNATEDCLTALMAMYGRIQCARSTRDYVTRNTSLMAECKCHPPCDEFMYDVSYRIADARAILCNCGRSTVNSGSTSSIIYNHLSKWPASGYEGDAAYLDVFYVENFRKRFENTSKNETVIEYFRDENRESTMKDFSRLNVYVADSNVIKTQESSDYEPNQLVSDIGGQLGIWVGISVITLSEVVELFCFLMRQFLTAQRTNDSSVMSDSTDSTTSGITVKRKRKFRKLQGNGDCSLNGAENGLLRMNGFGPKDCNGRNDRPYEYTPHHSTSFEQGYTFEPIERDRWAMFQTLFSEPYGK